jgi:hypothetical protein
MPEFILDHGTPEAARQFQQLDSFTQGYIEAMFFTDAEPDTVRPDEDSDFDNPNVWNSDKHSSLPGDATVADLSPEALEACVAACISFQKQNAFFLDIAKQLEPGEEIFRYAKEELDDRRLGQLFWYARCGHGVSFLDDGNALCLQELQKAAQAVGNVDSYMGDDGLIYLA